MESLEALIADRVGLTRDGVQAPDDPDLEALLKALTERFGSAIKAVLLYGSYTRGARDSLVDLYVLLDGYPAVVPRWQALANKLLPPNVYQLEGDTGVRCKYAALPLRQFVRRLERDFHSYFWARFAQPCQVLYVSDGVVASTLRGGLANAVSRFFTEAARVVPTPCKGLDLWRAGLQRTYRCELRAESGGRAETLIDSNSEYYEKLARAWGGLDNGSAGPIEHALYNRQTWRWPLREGLGKVLSVLRLVKAAFTFNDGFDYLLWKIERHSGIYIEPTPWQKRLPLLLAWPLFYRLYRLGAFR